MTGSEFYDYVLRRFKRTDKETEVYEAMTDVVMDIKLRYFFEDFKEESYTGGIAALGDYKLSLPTDFGHLIGDVNLIHNSGNSRSLNKLTKEAFDRKYTNPNASDVVYVMPKDYCIFSGQILIGGVPDSIDYEYQISYSTEAAEEMDEDTDEVPFCNRYRWIVRNLVLAELYYGMGNDAEGDKFKKQGEDGIGLMIANDDWNTDATTTQNYSDN